MKIAIVASQFPPRWLAGSELATKSIASHLAQNGHEVHVITSLDRGIPRESEETGFYIHRIPRPRVPFVKSVLFWPGILLVLKRIEADVVHANGMEVGMSAVVSKKLFGTPFVIWGQGSDIYLSSAFEKPIHRLILANANKAIALTEHMKLEMQRIYAAGDILVIPNGIDPENFHDLSRKQSRAKLQIGEKENIIVFVGTLRPVKGVEYLIRAVAILNAKAQDVRLIIVGDGEDRRDLENLVEELHMEDVVTFIGRVPNEKVPAYLVASDVFVLPSLSEGFALVNLEAMACGLPIVASEVGGLPDLIQNGENGFLVEPGNPHQIADKITLLLDNDSLREKISGKNKEKVKAYTWESVVYQLETIYQKLIVDC